MKQILYIFILIVSVISPAQNNQLFEQANTLYNDGKYAEAIDKYMAILSGDVHSSELYFNLANANYKLNNIAPSIYYYEKALQLSPDDQDIKNNLAFANNMTIDAIDTVPEVGFSRFIKNTTKVFSFDGWAKLSVALVILFVLLFLAYYFTFSAGSKRVTFIGSVLSLLFACITLTLSYHSYNLHKNDKPAIVFAEESQVKSEPNLRSEEAFRLHEGTKVQILDTVSNWKKIKLSDGKTGWIANNDIKAL